MGRSPAAETSSASAPASSSSSPSHSSHNGKLNSDSSSKLAKSGKASRKRAGKSQPKDAGAGRGEVDNDTRSRRGSAAQNSSDVASPKSSNAEPPGNPNEDGLNDDTVDNEASFRARPGSRARGTNFMEKYGLDEFCSRCRDGVFEFFCKHKPRIDAFAAHVMEWKLHARSLMQRAWPLVHKALLIFCGIVIMVAFGWINCAIQGVKSLFRLGAAAFFMVICCSILNLGILGGFFKLFLFLVLAAAAAFFVGYIYALAIFAVFSIVILWLYGSFWLTGGIILIEGVLFTADKPRVAILIGLIYSVFSTKVLGGWLWIILCMNLAFISSNLMIYLLHSNAADRSSQGFNGSTQQGPANAYKKQDRRGKQFDENYHTTSTGIHQGDAPVNTSGASTSEGEMNAVEKEVQRVLSCKDHYAVLELARFAEADVAALKRDYKKKAMLVHPDKNLGNVVAEEAFKRLQNAYETLLDPSKKQVYDDELKREEIISVLKRFQQEVLRNGRPDSWFTNPDVENENLSFRRVICKKCNKTHRWIFTDKNKLRARWCQECQDLHQAKDGDGWVEQLGHSVFFGMFQKMDAPRAYACAESRIYEVTEWVQCQGMKCAANTHKPSFHVSTAGLFKNQPRSSRGNKTPHGNVAEEFLFSQMSENMTEEEFIKWFENAMATGMFNDVPENPDQPDNRAGNSKPSRKKRKGKNKW